MKLIVAIVRPEQLSDVLEALFHAEVRGLTISRVQGHGGEMEHVENYRGTSVKMALAEKVRLEIGVSNHFVKPTIDAILAAARTGEVGDGKIMVLPIERIVRIRTGEEDQDAVTPVQPVERSALPRRYNLRGMTDDDSLVGQRIGVYELQALIGAGGMGGVYRARDTRLHRDVAVKLLPACVAADRIVWRDSSARRGCWRR